MKSKIIAMAAGALVSTAALAGQYQPAPVIVDLVAQTASGDLTTAANSNNDVELIGCGTRNFDDGLGSSLLFAFCQASDAEGNQITCATQNPALIEEIRGISDRSFITFSWNDEETCTRIGVSTQSFYLDKIKPSSNNKGKNGD